MMADPLYRKVPQKLKEPVTRDSFLVWDLNHRSFCRQKQEWLQFLPGGTSSTWLPFDEDETQGIKVFKTEMQEQGGRQVRVTLAEINEEATNAARASLAEFLNILGTYAPADFMHTVVYESTSYNWVLDKIRTTFRLKTKGLGFLAAADLKFDFVEDGKTYQQCFQSIKEFYCSALLKKGDKFEGKILDKNETFTPLSKNFIVEKWLDCINPGLKNHIRTSRGSLFTDDRPTLADNQLQLCDQMPQLLQELENDTQTGVNRMGISSQPATSINRTGFPYQNRRLPPRQSQPARTWPPTTGRTTGRSSCPSDTCLRCYEAKRTGPSTVPREGVG